MPAHLPAGLSDSSFIGLGFLVAAIAAAVQYFGWARYGGKRVSDGAPDDRRQALRRWVVFTIAWQVTVLCGVGLYIAANLLRHSRGGFWAAPAVGAVLGTALPLQLVVAGLLKNVRL